MRLRKILMGLVEVAAIVGGMLMVAGVAQGQLATTLVQDTVYLANGSPAQGSVIINWGAFQTASGQAIPPGSTTVTLSASGVLSVTLAANAGAQPVGSYYTVVYHLSDGTVTREYWVVPVSSSAVTLGAIRSGVLPTSVALQTVTKSYVDQAIAAAIPLASSGGSSSSSSDAYVPLAGGTMTGPLVLPGSPTAPLQAADKSYVDTSIAGLTAGLGQKVSTVPSGVQTVAQPTGTSLGVNALNGELYASQFQSGLGNNGIANVMASSNCSSGCVAVAEPTYAGTETWGGANLFGTQGLSWPYMSYLHDLRGGADTEVHKDAHNGLRPGYEFAHSIMDTRTRSTAALDAMGRQC